MVDFDCKSLRRDGRRFFLRAGEIHYFRIPRAEWRDRLTKAKLAGLNAVSVYVPWNYHEVAPGKYDFTGERDLAGFLKLCQELALGVLLRPGPYICAEWTFGGFPERLVAISDELRSSSPRYLAEVEGWIDAVTPLILRYSQDVGGPIMMVQLENEYGSFGDDSAYLNWLRDAYRRRGVTLPLYTCDGLDLVERGSIPGELACINLGTDVRRHAQYIRRVRSEQPAIASEFWAGWFDAWGHPSVLNEGSTAVHARTLMELLAYFDGYSIYMWSGGTNFGNTAGCTVGSTPYFVTTSYDYGAPVGETGVLRDGYFSYRRVNLLGMALEPILAAAGAPRELPAAPGLRLVERSAVDEGRGRVIFAFNDSDQAACAFVDGHTVLLQSGETAAVVEDLRLPGPLRIAWSSLPLAAIGFDGGGGMSPAMSADRTVMVIGYLSQGMNGRQLNLRSAPGQPIEVERAWREQAESGRPVHAGYEHGELAMGPVESDSDMGADDSLTHLALEFTYDEDEHGVQVQLGFAATGKPLATSLITPSPSGGVTPNDHNRQTHHESRDDDDERCAGAGSRVGDRTCTVRVKVGDWTYILQVLTEEQLDQTWIWSSTCRKYEEWSTLQIIPAKGNGGGSRVASPVLTALASEAGDARGAGVPLSPGGGVGSGGTLRSGRERELAWDMGIARTQVAELRSRHIEQLGPSSYLDVVGFRAENTSYFWYETTWYCPPDFPTGSNLALPVVGDRALIFLDGALIGNVGWDVARFVATHSLCFHPGPHRLAILVEALGWYNFGHHLAKPGLVGRKGLGFPVYVGGMQQSLRLESTGILGSESFRNSYRSSWSLSTSAHVFLFVKGIMVSRLRLRIDGAPVDTPTSAPYTDRYEMFDLGTMGKGEHRLVIGVVDTPFVSGPVGDPAADVIACPLGSEIPGPWQVYPESIPAEWKPAATPRAADSHATAGIWGTAVPAHPAQPGTDGRVTHRGEDAVFPRYFRTFLPAEDKALLLKPNGLSNGLIWVNRRWLGRYRQGGPQREYCVPSSWLYSDRPNELVIFDEEGRWPAAFQVTQLVGTSVPEPTAAMG